MLKNKTVEEIAVSSTVFIGEIDKTRLDGTGH
jgi:hypothetical protein